MAPWRDYWVTVLGEAWDSTSRYLHWGVGIGGIAMLATATAAGITWRTLGGEAAVSQLVWELGLVVFFLGFLPVAAFIGYMLVVPFRQHERLLARIRELEAQGAASLRETKEKAADELRQTQKEEAARIRQQDTRIRELEAQLDVGER